MAVGGLLGSTLQQSRADAGALWGGLRGWTTRSGPSVRIEYGGDALEVRASGEADQARLIEAFLKRQGAPDSEQSAADGDQGEHAPSPVPPPTAHVSAPGKGLAVIEGEPARLVIRLGITLVVLAIAIVAIVAKTSAEPAWGAVGAVVGYWLR
jgi:hypothetical protein